jgi:hypothetical protein
LPAHLAREPLALDRKHPQERGIQQRLFRGTSATSNNPSVRTLLNSVVHARPLALAALLLTGALSACAHYRSDEICDKGGCPNDANITANVQGSFAQHPELQGPDQLYVSTRDHVVYLSGPVETGLHRDVAASAARDVSGVTSVVNNIAIDK